ncbi:MAG TPA: Npt1/Npt2 family nucleotide transporter [Vicinamibacterales bacterium]|jgi:AAA family ATP:ADP antiporter|nr:Npt1/Npt2 family nucleotide transporter [Vicinamibacterales bacterium]
MSAPAERTDKNLLERALSVFTEVRAGEGVSALLLALNGFYLLAFYSVLKIVRDALILSESGPVAASYSAAGQAVMLLIFVPAYSAFAARVSRVWLVCGVTLFFASHLLIFYLVGTSGLRIGIAFYLWIGVFNMVAVAQFWAFANDLYSSERGKRLFPILGMGANLGAVAGAASAAVMFGGFGPYSLMLLAAVGLLVPVGLTIWVNRREQEIGQSKPEDSERPLAGRGGFQLVFSDRYLTLIALLVLVFSLVNTLGGFMLNRLITDEAASRVAAGTAGGLTQRELIGTMVGSVQTWVNALAFLLQAFAVSRIFKYIGVRGAMFVLPVIALGGYTAIALLPVFSIVRWAKVLENSTDYSVQNTTRHALFLPTSRQAKYTAKQAIDSFFVRAGDLLQAVIVFVGVRMAFGVPSYAVVNLILIGVWLALAVGIAREHKKLTAADTEERAA